MNQFYTGSLSLRYLSHGIIKQWEGGGSGKNSQERERKESQVGSVEPLQYTETDGPATQTPASMRIVC